MVPVDGDLKMDAGQRSGIEIRLETCQAAIIGPKESFRDPLAKTGVISFTWDINNRRGESVELIPAQEEARPRAPDKVQCAHDHRGQCFELVWNNSSRGQVSSRLAIAFSVCPPGVAPEASNDLQHPAADEGNGSAVSS